MTSALISRDTILATLDRRFWLVAVIGTIGALFVLGVPTAVLPNPFFVRMTATQPFDVAVWVASAPLIGLTIATFLAKPLHTTADPHSGAGGAPTSLGGIGIFLAIGCPICNKIVVGLLGVRSIGHEASDIL